MGEEGQLLLVKRPFDDIHCLSLPFKNQKAPIRKPRKLVILIVLRVFSSQNFQYENTLSRRFEFSFSLLKPHRYWVILIYTHSVRVHIYKRARHKFTMRSELRNKPSSPALKNMWNVGSINHIEVRNLRVFLN